MAEEDVIFPEEDETAEDFVEDQTNIETQSDKIEELEDKLGQLAEKVERQVKDSPEIKLFRAGDGLLGIKVVQTQVYNRKYLAKVLKKDEDGE